MLLSGMETVKLRLKGQELAGFMSPDVASQTHTEVRVFGTCSAKKCVTLNLLLSVCATVSRFKKARATATIETIGTCIVSMICPRLSCATGSTNLGMGVQGLIYMLPPLSSR